VLLRCLYIAVVGLMSCSLPVWGEWYSDTQDIMGTEVSATLWHENPVKAKAALVAVMSEMRRIDKMLSPYISGSELYRINETAAKAPVSISRELEALIDKSLYYSQISDGAFDISFASVGRYYDYRRKFQPDSKQRQALLNAIDYRLITLDKTHHTLFFAKPQLRIDLGGIAKGYAVDRAISLLRKQGVKHASVSAGGDSRVLGDKNGRPWLIGIKNPRAKDQVAVVLPLTDTAVSTSGDYERYFIDQETGQRVHHIINPGTGLSVSGVTSVSILGAMGFDTDPLSTTVFVLGVEKGLQLINRLKGIDGIIIDSKGKMHYSEGLMPPRQNME